MEDVYRRLPLAKLPWNSADPPRALLELVDSGKVRPCKTLDLGCGAGNYAVWLASLGFDVTGVDVAPTAIRLAEQNATGRRMKCRFVVADLTADVTAVGGPFDFAYGWDVLHHVFPVQRPSYVANVHRLLRPGARYLSVCFHEADRGFGGQGRYRTTPIGTVLYFSSECELAELFHRRFTILEQTVIEVGREPAPHVANYVWMEKPAATI